MGFIIFFSLLQIEVKSYADRDTVTVGDEIKYTLEIKKKPTIKVTLPELKGNLGNFELKRHTTKQRKKRIDATYILTIFRTGMDTIPSIKIRYDSTETETRKIPIAVVSVLPEKATEPKEIKPPVEIPMNFVPLIIIISTIVIVLVVLFLIKRKLEKNKQIEEEREQRPADEIAYERLEKLKLGEDIKKYYTELSDIIRRYIEARYRIPGPLETTDELYRAMKKARIRLSIIETVRSFLDSCDLVKFAKYIPNTDEIGKDTKAGKEIIDRTK